MSLRKAIDEMCRSCIYDPACGGGTWREQVAQCSCVSCPLWGVRPMPGSGPYASAPRKVEDLPRWWKEMPVGYANSGHLNGKL